MEVGYSGRGEGTCESPQALVRNIQPSIEERLLRRKNQLEGDLKDVNVALEALQANPEILKIMCLISKVNY